MSSRFFLRSIALTLSILFPINDLCWAAASRPGSAETPAALPASIPSIRSLAANPHAIELPAQGIHLKDARPGTDGRLLILIEDAHANYGGQKNIASTLNSLARTYGIRTVFLEGGDRKANLDALQAVTGPRERRIGAEQLLREGILSGPEHLSLTSDEAIDFYGVENSQHYRAALLAYARVSDLRSASGRDLNDVRNALEAIKIRTYPEALLRYESEKRLHADADPSRIDRLFALARQSGASLDAFPSLVSIDRIRAAQSRIDFRAVNQEQESLVAGLRATDHADEAERLAREIGRTASPAELKRLIDRLLALSGEIRPNLSAYSAYLDTFKAVDWESVLTESETLEALCYKNQLRDPDARRIAVLDIYLNWIQKAFELTLTSREFGLLKSNRSSFESDAWIGFLQKKSDALGIRDSRIPERPFFDRAWPSVRAFYSLVALRDHALIENAGRILEERKEKAAVLVVGGYHTDHLKELLSRQGSGWAVLTPQVTSETDRENYEQVLLMPLKKRRAAPAATGDRFLSKSPVIGMTETYFDSVGSRLAGKEASKDAIVSTLRHLRSGARMAGDDDLVGQKEWKKKEKIELKDVRIVLAEDNSAHSRRIRQELVAAGADPSRILVIEDVHEIINTLNQIQGLQIVLMDITFFQDLDGFDILEDLQPRSTSRVIVLNSDDSRHITHLGDQYIKKFPVSGSILQDAIRDQNMLIPETKLGSSLGGSDLMHWVELALIRLNQVALGSNHHEGPADAYHFYSEMPESEKRKRLYHIIWQHHDYLGRKIERHLVDIRKAVDSFWGLPDSGGTIVDGFISYRFHSPAAVYEIGKDYSKKIAWGRGLFVPAEQRGLDLGFATTNAVIEALIQRGFKEFHVGNTELPGSQALSADDSNQRLAQRVIDRYNGAVSQVNAGQNEGSKILRYTIDLEKASRILESSNGAAEEVPSVKINDYLEATVEKGRGLSFPDTATITLALKDHSPVHFQIRRTVEESAENLAPLVTAVIRNATADWTADEWATVETYKKLSLLISEALNIRESGARMAAKQYTGLSFYEDLVAIVKREEAFYAGELKFGDPAFGFLVGSEKEMLAYLRRAIRGEKQPTELAAESRPWGRMYPSQAMTQVYARYCAAYPQDPYLSYQTFVEAFGLQLSRGGYIFVEGFDPQENDVHPHRVFFEEVLHLLEGWDDDLTASDWVRECINSFIQILFLSDEQIRENTDAYLHRTKAEEFIALKNRYLYEKGLDPNYDLNRILDALRQDLRDDTMLRIGSRRIRILSMLVRSYGLFEIMGPHNPGIKRAMTRELKKEFEAALLSLSTHGKYSEYQPLLPSWRKPEGARMASDFRQPTGFERFRYWMEDQIERVVLSSGLGYLTGAVSLAAFIWPHRNHWVMLREEFGAVMGSAPWGALAYAAIGLSAGIWLVRDRIESARIGLGYWFRWRTQKNWESDLRQRGVILSPNGRNVGNQLLFGSTLGPLAEEIVFRSILLPFTASWAAGSPGVTGIFSAVTGIFASAVFFSVAHDNDSLPSFNKRFKGGIFFGSLYVLTGNLIAPVLAHMAINLTLQSAIFSRSLISLPNFDPDAARMATVPLTQELLESRPQITANLLNKYTDPRRFVKPEDVAEGKLRSWFDPGLSLAVMDPEGRLAAIFMVDRVDEDLKRQNVFGGVKVEEPGIFVRKARIDDRYRNSKLFPQLIHQVVKKAAAEGDKWVSFRVNADRVEPHQKNFYDRLISNSGGQMFVIPAEEDRPAYLLYQAETEKLAADRLLARAAGARMAITIPVGPDSGRPDPQLDALARALISETDPDRKADLTQQLILTSPQIRSLIDDERAKIFKIQPDTVFSFSNPRSAIRVDMPNRKIGIYSADRGLVGSFDLELDPNPVAMKLSEFLYTTAVEAGTGRAVTVDQIFQGLRIATDSGQENFYLERGMTFVYDRKKQELSVVIGHNPDHNQIWTGAVWPWHQPFFRGHPEFKYTYFSQGRIRNRYRIGFDSDAQILFDLHFHPTNNIQMSDGDKDCLATHSYYPSVVADLKGNLAIYVARYGDFIPWLSWLGHEAHYHAPRYVSKAGEQAWSKSEYLISEFAREIYLRVSARDLTEQTAQVQKLVHDVFARIRNVAITLVLDGDGTESSQSTALQTVLQSHPRASSANNFRWLTLDQLRWQNSGILLEYGDDPAAFTDERWKRFKSGIETLPISRSMGDQMIKSNSSAGENSIDPVAAWIVRTSARVSARKKFYKLLSTLNRYWWLIQDEPNGYRDKEAMGYRLSGGRYDDEPSKEKVLSWTDEELVEKRRQLAGIVNDRISKGYLAGMLGQFMEHRSMFDIGRLFHLLDECVIPYDRSLALQKLDRIGMGKPIEYFDRPYTDQWFMHLEGQWLAAEPMHPAGARMAELPSDWLRVWRRARDLRTQSPEQMSATILQDLAQDADQTDKILMHLAEELAIGLHPELFTLTTEEDTTMRAEGPAVLGSTGLAAIVLRQAGSTLIQAAEALPEPHRNRLFSEHPFQLLRFKLDPTAPKPAVKAKAPDAPKTTFESKYGIDPRGNTAIITLMERMDIGGMDEDAAFLVRKVSDLELPSSSVWGKIAVQIVAGLPDLEDGLGLPTFSGDEFEPEEPELLDDETTLKAFAEIREWIRSTRAALKRKDIGLARFEANQVYGMLEDLGWKNLRPVFYPAQRGLYGDYESLTRAIAQARRPETLAAVAVSAAAVATALGGRIGWLWALGGIAVVWGVRHLRDRWEYRQARIYWEKREPGRAWHDPEKDAGFLDRLRNKFAFVEVLFIIPAIIFTLFLKDAFTSSSKRHAIRIFYYLSLDELLRIKTAGGAAKVLEDPQNPLAIRLEGLLQLELGNSSDSKLRNRVIHHLDRMLDLGSRMSAAQKETVGSHGMPRKNFLDPLLNWIDASANIADEIQAKHRPAPDEPLIVVSAPGSGYWAGELFRRTWTALYPDKPIRVIPWHGIPQMANDLTHEEKEAIIQRDWKDLMELTAASSNPVILLDDTIQRGSSMRRYLRDAQPYVNGKSLVPAGLVGFATAPADYLIGWRDIDRSHQVPFWYYFRGGDRRHPPHKMQELMASKMQWYVPDDQWAQLTGSDAGPAATAFDAANRLMEKTFPELFDLAIAAWVERNEKEKAKAKETGARMAHRLEFNREVSAGQTVTFTLTTDDVRYWNWSGNNPVLRIGVNGWLRPDPGPWARLNPRVPAGAPLTLEIPFQRTKRTGEYRLVLPIPPSGVFSLNFVVRMDHRWVKDDASRDFEIRVEGERLWDRDSATQAILSMTESSESKIQAVRYLLQLDADGIDAIHRNGEKILSLLLHLLVAQRVDERLDGVAADAMWQILKVIGTRCYPGSDVDSLIQNMLKSSDSHYSPATRIRFLEAALFMAPYRDSERTEQKAQIQNKIRDLPIASEFANTYDSGTLAEAAQYLDRLSAAPESARAILLHLYRISHSLYSDPERARSLLEEAVQMSGADSDAARAQVPAAQTLAGSNLWSGLVFRRDVRVGGRPYTIERLSNSRIEKLQEVDLTLKSAAARWPRSLFAHVGKSSNVSVLTASVAGRIVAYFVVSKEGDDRVVLKSACRPETPAGVMNALWDVLRDNQDYTGRGKLKSRALTYEPDEPEYRAPKQFSEAPDPESIERIPSDEALFRVWAARQFRLGNLQHVMHKVVKRFSAMSVETIWKAFKELGFVRPKTHPEIRAMHRSDLDDVMELEKAEFEHPDLWSAYGFFERDFGEEGEGDGSGGVGMLDPEQSKAHRKRMVAIVDGKLAGYLVYHVHEERIQVLKLVVAPAYRHSYVGRAFLEHLKAEMSNLELPFIAADIPADRSQAPAFFANGGFELLPVHDREGNLIRTEAMYWDPQIDVTLHRNKEKSSKFFLWLSKARKKFAAKREEKLASLPRGVALKLERAGRHPWLPLAADAERKGRSAPIHVELLPAAKSSIAEAETFLKRNSRLVWNTGSIREFSSKGGIVLVAKCGRQIVGVMMVGRFKEHDYYEAYDYAFDPDQDWARVLGSLVRKIRVMDGSELIHRLLWEIPVPDFALLPGTDTRIAQLGFDVVASESDAENGESDAGTQGDEVPSYLLKLQLHTPTEPEATVNRWIRSLDGGWVSERTIQLMAQEFGVDDYELMGALRRSDIGIEQPASKGSSGPYVAREKWDASKTHVRWMIRRDMNEILAIERMSKAGSSVEPWSEEVFVKHLRRRDTIGMVVERNDQVVGFMLYELHSKRLDVLRFELAPDARGRGLGRRMMEKLIGKLTAQRRNRIRIVVSENNVTMQTFLRHMGFRAVSVLRDTYGGTDGDHYVFEYKWRPAEGEDENGLKWDDEPALPKEENMELSGFPEQEITEKDRLWAWGMRQPIEVLVDPAAVQSRIEYLPMDEARTFLRPIRVNRLTEWLKDRHQPQSGDMIENTETELSDLFGLTPVQIQLVVGWLGLRTRNPNPAPLEARIVEESAAGLKSDMNLCEQVDVSNPPPSGIWTWSKFDQAVESGHTLRMALDSQGNVIGYVLYHLDDEDRLHIVRLNIKKSGRFRGVEEKLIEAAEASDTAAASVRIQAEEGDRYLHKVIASRGYRIKTWRDGILEFESGQSVLNRILSSGLFHLEMRHYAENIEKMEGVTVRFVGQNEAVTLRSTIEDLDGLLRDKTGISVVTDRNGGTLSWRAPDGSGWVTRSLRSPLEVQEIVSAVETLIRKKYPMPKSPQNISESPAGARMAAKGLHRESRTMTIRGYHGVHLRPAQFLNLIASIVWDNLEVRVVGEKDGRSRPMEAPPGSGYSPWYQLALADQSEATIVAEGPNAEVVSAVLDWVEELLGDTEALSEPDEDRSQKITTRLARIKALNASIERPVSEEELADLLAFFQIADWQVNQTEPQSALHSQAARQMIYERIRALWAAALLEKDETVLVRVKRGVLSAGGRQDELYSMLKTMAHRSAERGIYFDFSELDGFLEDLPKPLAGKTVTTVDLALKAEELTTDQAGLVTNVNPDIASLVLFAALFARADRSDLVEFGDDWVEVMEHLYEDPDEVPLKELKSVPADPAARAALNREKIRPLQRLIELLQNLQVGARLASISA